MPLNFGADLQKMLALHPSAAPSASRRPFNHMTLLQPGPEAALSTICYPFSRVPHLQPGTALSARCRPPSQVPPSQPSAALRAECRRCPPFSLCAAPHSGVIPQSSVAQPPARCRPSLRCHPSVKCRSASSQMPPLQPDDAPLLAARCRPFRKVPPIQLEPLPTAGCKGAHRGNTGPCPPHATWGTMEKRTERWQDAF